ncbi:MAG TPA: glycerophosphodiester phosphodiesterase [Mycobacteriales bacterium]|nr:glycerophosphodiester phosphodiesterase [Mycobacteriales bacterium]
MRYAFAHRGGRAHGPDNTIPTFATALAAGAVALETDAWVTADGIVVLDHDGIHRHASGRQTAIAETHRELLLPHIPTLADLYRSCGTAFDLAIDVKGEGTAQAILDVALGFGAAERLWLFTPSTTRPGDVAPAHAGVTVSGEQLRGRSDRNALLEQLKADGIQVVNARWPYWRRAAVAEVHELGMLAFAWDVQWSVAVWRCRRLGIDGIFSDHVRLLRRSVT